MTELVVLYCLLTPLLPLFKAEYTPGNGVEYTPGLGIRSFAHRANQITQVAQDK